MNNENNIVLSAEEELKLIQKAQKGNIKSWEKLLSANKKHIDELSNKFFGCGLSKDKIVQYGTVGFLIAISKFKNDKNFLSYADFWMEKIIHDAIYIYKSDCNINIEKYNGIMPKFSISSKDIIISESYDSAGERLVDIIGEKFFITEAEVEEMELEARRREETYHLEYEIRSALMHTLKYSTYDYEGVYYGFRQDTNGDYLKKSFKNVAAAINDAREKKRLEDIKKMELLQKKKANQILNGIWPEN